MIDLPDGPLAREQRLASFCSYAPAYRYVAASIEDVSFEQVMNFGVLQLLESTRALQTLTKPEVPKRIDELKAKLERTERA